MGKEEQPKSERTADTGRVKITISMTASDAKRLEQAFAEGKLAELGIDSIQVLSDQNSLKQWGEEEIEKHMKARDTKRSGPQ